MSQDLVEVNGKTSTCIFFHELGQHERGMTWMKGWATPTCRISCSGELPLRSVLAALKALVYYIIGFNGPAHREWPTGESPNWS